MINSIEIDKLTPCLERLKGNEIVNTSYIFANESELSGLKNWLFNWNDTGLKDCEIFELSVEGDERIQGLVALHIMKRDRAVLIGNPHPYRMIIDEEAAYKLKQVYNFRRDQYVRKGV